MGVLGLAPDFRVLQFNAAVNLSFAFSFYHCISKHGSTLLFFKRCVTGKRNWSTYSFIVDMRRNWLFVDRVRKLVYVQFKVKLLGKVHAVDYNSENFAWEVEEVEVESEVENLLVDDRVITIARWVGKL
jgi:hypothetical protein